MDNEMTDWAAHVLRRIVFRQDGGLTIAGKIIGIVTLLFIFAACSALSGCVNLYTRCPFTEKKIERTYQSTREAYSLSIIISWPQIMSDNPGDGGFMVENLLTIPLGFLGMCDTACEGVLDTVFLPADWVISDMRKDESDK